ncbi:MAG TPA: cyclic nucleotide-binding domain-containing protein [Candidatus Limnocylindria bacterium]|nr:cyclic nucleotide-binding domain-containing protein [Candidatus Limnocylindria bacterium]
MRTVARRLFAIRSVPASVVVITAAVSYVAQMIAIIQGWPLWAIAGVTLLPWIPLFTIEMAWTYRHYEWLALFYVLVITQVGHFIEHVTQMVQIHVLGLKGLDARGIFGQLDVEWVHFTWNTWIIVAVLLLLTRFRGNRWLWATLVLAGWHEIEHLVIMSAFLATGKAGTPGLLSQGGLILGGLPLPRPDVHFIYNLIETTPLAVAFVVELRRAYDQWVRRALPSLSEKELVEATDRAQVLRFRAGDDVVREGEPADRFYIVTKGELAVSQAIGQIERPLRTLAPGDHFGEIGLLSRARRTATVRALTDSEVLAFDANTFGGIVRSSEATARDLARVAQERLAT